MARNSACSVIHTHAALKNASTKNNAALTGLRIVTTIAAANTSVAAKK